MPVFTWQAKIIGSNCGAGLQMITIGKNGYRHFRSASNCLDYCNGIKHITCNDFVRIRSKFILIKMLSVIFCVVS